MTGDAAETYGYLHAGHKEALVNRMRRIEGQARGIEKMITDERYCIDILTQIAAVTTALETVAGKILDDHVNHCVAVPSRPGTKRSPPRRAASCSRPCTASPAPGEPLGAVLEGR